MIEQRVYSSTSNSFKQKMIYFRSTSIPISFNEEIIFFKYVYSYVEDNISKNVQFRSIFLIFNDRFLKVNFYLSFFFRFQSDFINSSLCFVRLIWR